MVIPLGQSDTSAQGKVGQGLQATSPLMIYDTPAQIVDKISKKTYSFAEASLCGQAPTLNAQTFLDMQKAAMQMSALKVVTSIMVPKSYFIGHPIATVPSFTQQQPLGAQALHAQQQVDDIVWVTLGPKPKKKKKEPIKLVINVNQDNSTGKWTGFSLQMGI